MIVPDWLYELTYNPIGWWVATWLAFRFVARRIA
jgi:hypothetical protein